MDRATNKLLTGVEKMKSMTLNDLTNLIVTGLSVNSGTVEQLINMIDNEIEMVMILDPDEIRLVQGSSMEAYFAFCKACYGGAVKANLIEVNLTLLVVMRLMAWNNYFLCEATDDELADAALASSLAVRMFRNEACGLPRSATRTEFARQVRAMSFRQVA